MNIGFQIKQLWKTQHITKNSAETEPKFEDTHMKNIEYVKIRAYFSKKNRIRIHVFYYIILIEVHNIM